MQQTVFGVAELSERWRIDRQSIRKLEQMGKLHRLPDLPGVKYSAAEVFKLESVGLDAKGMTAWERRQMQEEIKDLRQQVQDLTSRLLKAQQVLQGGVT